MDDKDKGKESTKPRQSILKTPTFKRPFPGPVTEDDVRPSKSKKVNITRPPPPPDKEQNVTTDEELNTKPKSKPKGYKFDSDSAGPPSSNINIRRNRKNKSQNEIEEEDKTLQIQTTKKSDPLNDEKENLKPIKTSEPSFFKQLLNIDIITPIKLALARLEVARLLNSGIDPDTFCIIAIGMIPFLVVFLVWDIIAAAGLDIPHLSFLPHNGILWPFHFLTLPLSMYGYIMNRLRLRKSRLNTYCYIIILTHVPFFALRLLVDWLFYRVRDEHGAYFGKYIEGPNTRPDDFDSDFQYEALRRAKFWQLVYAEDEDDTSPDTHAFEELLKKILT